MRFQKIAYLLKEKEKIQVSYNFIPYLYGPYSRELQMDLAFLCSLGLVDERHNDRYYSYMLTKEGIRFLRSRRLPRSTSILVRSACKNYGKLSTNQLVGLAHKIQDSQ